MQKIEKLPEDVEQAVSKLIALWADHYLPGKPALLGAATYATIEQTLIKKTNEIIETFPDEKEPA